MRATGLVLTLATSTLASPLSWLFTRQQACNGIAALCDRKYSDVSFIGTHDSPFYGDEDDPRLTQTKSVPDQLKAGIRFLQSQTHKDPINPNSLNMCHTSCLLENKGPVTDYLKDIKTFLDANPNEVITLLMVNGDSVSPSLFANAFQSANLVDQIYAPASPISRDAWPTLADMISMNKRLVVFLDTGADQSQVPYLLDEFTYYFETKYQNYSPSDFTQCEADRGSNGDESNGAESKMYIMNHFRYKKLLSADIPDPDDAAATNSASGAGGSIGAQVHVCRARWGGRAPNVVLVDFFDQGHVFAAQKAMNGL